MMQLEFDPGKRDKILGERKDCDNSLDAARHGSPHYFDEESQ